MERWEMHLIVPVVCFSATKDNLLLTYIFSAKPGKKARVTPTSRINELELVIVDLQTRLEEAEDTIATMAQANVGVRESLDLNKLLKAEEMRAKEWEDHQRERVAERKEHEARGHELRAMSDIVTQIWETMRLGTFPAQIVAEGAHSTISPTILYAPNPPDAPRTTSLSPSDILQLREQQNASSETEPSTSNPISLPNPAIGELPEVPRDGGHLDGGVDDFEMGDMIHGDTDRHSGPGLSTQSADVQGIQDVVAGPVGHPIGAIVNIVTAVLDRGVMPYDGTLPTPIPLATDSTESTVEGQEDNEGDATILVTGTGEDPHCGASNDHPVPHPGGAPSTIMEVDNDASAERTEENEDDKMVVGEQFGKEPVVPEPEAHQETKDPVADGATNPPERQLRQRTPGLDYLKIGNPQARGPRSKSSSKPASPLPGPSSLPTVPEDTPTPSVP
jgi:hypothetical protein